MEKNLSSLKRQAREIGLRTSRTDTVESLSQRLFAMAHDKGPRATAAELEKANEVRQAKVTVMTMTNEDELKKALKPFLDKGVALELNHADYTWRLSYKGVEDTGHLSVPVDIIKRKAEIVAQGPRKIYKSEDGFMLV